MPAVCLSVYMFAVCLSYLLLYCLSLHVCFFQLFLGMDIYLIVDVEELPLSSESEDGVTVQQLVFLGYTM